MSGFIHPYHTFRHDAGAFANAAIRRVVFAPDAEGIPTCILSLRDDYRDGKLRVDAAEITKLTAAFGSPLAWVNRRVAVSVKHDPGEHGRANLVIAPLGGQQ